MGFNAKKTLFRRKDFFGSDRASKAMRVLREADTTGGIFNRARRTRALRQEFDAVSKDGKVTYGEAETALKNFFGKHYVAGAARRAFVDNLGLPEMTQSSIDRHMRQQSDALRAALGRNDKRTDLPHVVRAIPVKGDDGAGHATEIASGARRVRELNKKIAQQTLGKVDGMVNTPDKASVPPRRFNTASLHS